MQKHVISFGLAVALSALALTGCQKETPARTGTAAPAPVPAAEPTVPSLPDTEWTLHGLDTGEQRYSTLDQINRDSIGELERHGQLRRVHQRRGCRGHPPVCAVGAAMQNSTTSNCRSAAVSALFDRIAGFFSERRALRQTRSGTA